MTEDTSFKLKVENWYSLLAKWQIIESELEFGQEARPEVNSKQKTIDKRDIDHLFTDDQHLRLLELRYGVYKSINSSFIDISRMSGVDSSYFWIEGSLKGLQLNYQELLTEYLYSNPDKNEANFICKLMDDVEEAHKDNYKLLLKVLFEDILLIHQNSLNNKLQYLNQKLGGLGYFPSRVYDYDVYGPDKEEFEGYYYKTAPMKLETTTSIDKKKYREIKDYHFSEFEAVYFLKKIGLPINMYNSGYTYKSIGEILSGLISRHPKNTKTLIRLNENEYSQSQKQQALKIDKILQNLIKE